ncbi:MAG TPA: non-ribosomal peptide synthase/polyketide synthase [Thermoanaerobaculia bacterium]|nr:non-ribosomal peptide synthase/polyketide synthase [Thermoanaerobaculia bacterium]
MSLADRISALAPEQRALFEKLRGQRRRAARLREPPPIPRVSGLTAEGDWPLSLDQERYWFMEQLYPDQAGLNITAATRMRGLLSPAIVAAALSEVVRRHAAWRTVFPIVEGRPVQRVLAPRPQPLRRVDLAGLPAARREPEALRLVRADAASPFDLVRGPLVRASLVRLGAGDHICLLTVHHLVTDWISFQIAWAELAAFAQAFAAGARPALPEPAVHYPDYALWQRGWLQGEVLDELTSWWREQLAAYPPVLELPADRPRPAALRMRGGQLPFTTTGALAGALRGLARREGATLFMLILAAAAALLHRDSGQERLILGANNANRNRPEIEPVLGCFLTQVPFAVDLAGDPTFRELLARVRHSALGAYAHQDLPFGRLVQTLGLERDPGRQPLIQVLVQVLDGQYSKTALAGAAFEGVNAHDGRSRYDLMLTVFDYPEALVGALEYDADLFDATTTARRIERLLLQAAAVVADPEIRLSALPVLSAAARHQATIEWNDTARQRPAWTAPERFAEQAARTPEALAAAAAGETLSYRELHRRAGALAGRLRALGIGAGSRVALLLERGLDVPVAIFGVWKAGGAYVPLDADSPARRLADLLADAAPAAVIHRGPLPVALPGGTQPVDLAFAAPPRAAGEAPPAAAAGDLAYLIYTSGTTGRPKAVMIEHGSLAVTLASFIGLYGLGPGDRVPCLSRYSFDASLLDLVAPLLAGAAVEILGREEVLDPERLLPAIERSTAVISVPALLRRIAPAAREREARRFAGVRALSAGAEVVSPELQAELLAAFPAAEVDVLYGPTEAAVICTGHRVGRDRPPARALIGRALPEVEVRVVDPRGEPVALGLPGELWIGGPGVARGYFRRDELTAERFVEADGRRFYRTGDRVRQVPAEGGALEFLGRIDLQVKVRGFRVEPGEVEATLLAHPALREAVVVAHAGAAGDHQLAAYVVAAPGAAAPAEELRAFLRERLPEPMVPATFVPLAALPLTPSGKVDRKALPDPAAARAAGAVSTRGPRDPKEHLLAGIWRSVLGLARVGVHDNFFQLGGDSILSIQVVARARQAGLLITPKLFFDHQTIAGLAAAAAGAGEWEGGGAGQEPVVGEAPLTPIQRRFFAEERRRPWHFNQAVLLAPRARLAAAPLAAALARLAEHHDALRLRFRCTGAGWVQLHAPIVGATPETPETPGAMARSSAPLYLIDLAVLPQAARAPALAAAARGLQSGLDLARGPLFTAALFRRGEEGDRLLLTAHHLIVDGVSWRLLLEDLTAAYRQLAAGAAPALPPKTTAWKSWAERLETWSRTAELEAEELPYWLAALPAVPPLPQDRPVRGGAAGAAGTEGAAGAALASVAVELAREPTRALLQEVPEVYRTQVNDLLLAALALAFAGWTGEGTLLVDLEGHGREEVFAGVDLSRTVGWFTTLFPVALALPPGGGPRQAIQAVKEILRAVPRRGLGYGVLRYLAGGEAGERLAALPAPQVSFNYLGRLDAAVDQDGLFALAPDAPGDGDGEPVAGRHLFAVDALVLDARLRVNWTYDPGRHRADTVEQLAGGFLAALEGLVAHCQSPAAGGCTPSDFPLARLGQAALDRLLGNDRGVEDLYPLAPLQQGILFHTLYTAGAELYVEQLTAELLGPLDVPAFAAAWQRVVERHPALRTAFLWQQEGPPLQLVRRQAALPWRVEDWRGLPPALHDALWRDLLAADRARGFDLGRPPLLRLVLARTGAESHRLLWSSHHLLFDGWCFSLLLGEVFTLYAAAAAGREARLPPPPRPFRDYIAWLAGRDEEEAEAHWRRLLRGFTAPTPLPFDRPAGDEGGSRASDYHERTATLPAPETAALEALAQRLQVTVNTLVQGCWALLLARYAQVSDVVFGTVVSGRPAELPGAESMVGLFINTVPMRVEIPPAEPSSAWLVRLQASQFELREHAWTPLARIQALAEVPAGEPLFASLLAYENYPLDRSLGERLGELRIGDVAVGERTNYPLTLTAVARGDLSLRLTASRRFEPATARRMLAHLANLLGALADDAERPPRSLPLLAAAERHQLTAEWNDTAADFPAASSIPELFAEQAARRPDAPALLGGGLPGRGRLSYRELAERAAALAGELARRGIGRGDLVGLFAERSAELVIAILAVLEAGAAYVPLDPSYPPERLALMLADIGGGGGAGGTAPLVLVQPGLAARLPAGAGRTLPLAALETRAAREEGEAPGESLGGWASGRGVRVAAAGAGSDDLAYVIYTSGSTGRPKGVAVSHRAVVRLVRGTGYAELGPDEVFLMMAPVSFDASTFELWGPLLNGGCLAILPPGELSVDGLERAIRELGVTTLWLSAGLFHLVAGERPAALAPLRQLLAGGDVLSPPHVARLRRELPGLRLVNGYGPTENTTFTACHRVGDPAPAGGARVPIGRPIANGRVLVLDRDLEPAPIGVPGELFAAGAGLALGYLGRPELTAAAFVPAPFGEVPGERLYRTGDLVRRLPDGSLDFLGRVDRQVKVRGFRVEPGEIEALLAGHPAVREAVVVAVRDGGRERRLVAYAVPRDGARPPLDPAAVLADLAGRLPAFMVPAELVWLDALPLSPSGKLDRAAVSAAAAAATAAAPDGPAPAEAAECTPPRDAVEAVLAGIWREVLGRERVGVHDSFFRLGGDSILSIQVVARARRAGWVVTPRQIFEEQTIAALARVAAPLAAAAPGGEVAGEVPLTPVQRWFFAARPVAPHHFNQSLLLLPREPLAPAPLGRALAALTAHHDALRLRFAADGDGAWRSWIVPREKGALLATVELAALPEARRTGALEAAATALQAGFDLAAGPLFRAVRFVLAAGEPERLLLAAHHLVVDGVSWRLLLDELETAHRQAAAGRPVALPARTTSWKRWAERLAEHARSAAVRGELAYWLSAPTAAAPLPRDGGGPPGGGAAAGADVGALTTSLGRDATRALLGEAPAAWRAEVNDLLLTALVQAFARWTAPASGETRLRIALEGHGREEVAPDVDVSRTVGWFTIIFPVVLAAAPQAPPGEALRTVQATLRAVPQRGLGYGLLRYLAGGDEATRLAAAPEPEVAFNYLGQLDGVLGASARWAPAPESAGPERSPRQARRHAIEVNAWVLGGELRVVWSYSPSLHGAPTIERLAQGYLAALAALAAPDAVTEAPGRVFPRSAEAAGRAPSGLPDLGLAGGAAAGNGTVEDVYPLAPLQEGMLFAALFAPGSELYFEHLTAELTGTLDDGAFARAWQAVVDRHPALRTGFAWEGLARPLQVVRRRVDLPWTFEDWRQVPSGEVPRRLAAWLAADRARPFDLTRPPLMRAALLRLGERRHRFVWSFHHLLLDGWCFSPIFHEVFASYLAALAGRAADLPAVRPYRDFIAWAERQDAAAAENYFRRALAGFAEPTRLPLDRPALPAGDDGEPRCQELRLPPPLAAGLAGLARRRGLTLNTVVQGAWGLLLARHGGEPDVVFGTVVSGRPAELPGVESMIGLFINTLPVRLAAAAAAPLGAWLAGVQKRLLEVRQHETAALAAIQRWSAVPPGEPLFRSLVAFENYPVEESLGAGAGDLAVGEVTVSDRTDYPLSLAALPGRGESGGLALRLAHDRRTEAATARRLLAHLELLLGAFAEGIELPLGALPALAAAERHQLLLEWNDTAPAAGTGAAPAPCLHDLVAAQARRLPAAVALAAGGREMSYGELDRRANRLANHLRGLGVGPEVLVALMVERSLDMLVAVLGILKAGGAYMPIDPETPAERLGFLLADARPALLLTESALAERLPEALLPRQGGAALAAVPVVALDRERRRLAAASAAPPPAAVAADNLAYVIYTSGSTGAPKGVAVRHGSAVEHVLAAARDLGLGPGDREMHFAALGFDASVVQIFAPLCSGAAVVPRLGPAEAPLRFFADCTAERITVLDLPTAYWHQLAAALAAGEAALPPRVRAIVFGGEPALPEWWTAWGRGPGRGVRLINAYGPTEATVAPLHHEHPGTPDPIAGRRQVPIGRPLAGQRAYVVDRELRPVPVGGIGELLLGGSGPARGYLARPELTAERFVPDPFAALFGARGARLYRSGDLARVLPDGTIEFAGRLDAQVKVRGFRVEPGEIEAALAAHPRVRAAGVAVRRNAAGDGSLFACVVPAEAASPPAPAELRAFLAERLPGHLVPSSFAVLSALPLMASGKLDRRALAAASGEAGGAVGVAGAAGPTADGAGAATPPGTPVEKAMAELWRQVLGVAEVSLEDDFFALGGHSLLATRLASRVRAVFGVDLPIRRLFERPLLGDLAATVAAAPPLGAARMRVTPRPPGLEPLPASFAQERLWFLDRLQPGNTAFNMGGSLRLRGRLDVAALARALDEIVRRHEALRTTFGEVAGRPVQRIAASLRLPLPVVDLSSLGEAVREAEAERVAGVPLSAPFDLAAGPLMRAALLALAADLHLFVEVVHHIVSDGWSAAVMHRELLVLYAAFRAGRPSPLPALPVQYGDFALWQREWLRGEELETQLAYWRGKLGGSPAPLDLAADRPRPPVQTFRGGEGLLRVPAATAHALRRLSREQGASLFMTLLAAFQALLSRLSGQHDVVVGSPIAGRRHVETEELIGFFLNTLALRTDLGGNPSFRELLGRVRETTLGAFAHQDVPFEALLAELKPERDLSRTPVFQVFFNMLNLPGEAAADPGGPALPALPELEIEAGPAPRAESKFDLTLYVGEAAEAIEVRLVYNADLFDAPRMEELLRQYRAVLEWAAGASGERLGTVSLVTPEAAAVLPDPCRPLGAAWHGAVHQLFLAQARRDPGRTAVIDPRGSWSYGDLAAAALSLAARLREAGLEPEERVAIWAHRSAPLAWAVLGALAAGGAFVLLDPAYPAARLVEILRMAEPRAWLALAAAGPPPAAVEELLGGWEREGRLLARVVLPGGGPAAAAGLLAALPPASEAAASGPDDLAFVAFTSGSTGAPKGILGRHGPLSHFLPWQCARFGLDAADRYSLLSGLAHDPLQRDLFTALATGATLCAPDPEEIFVPGRLAAWAAQQGITVANLTPALGQVLTEPPRDGAAAPRIPSLRWVFLVGDVLTRLDVDRIRRLAPGAACVNLYGSTETQRALGFHVVDSGAGAAGQRARQVLPLGRGMEDAQILVLNAAERLAGIGELGEIWLRSPHLARGYLGDEALTRQHFRPNPFTGRAEDRVYRTGDLGRYRPDGEAVFAGRADDQIKLRGFRIEPGEIEAAIGRLAGVRDSVVVACEDGGERYLAAYVVPEPAAAPGLAGRLRPFLAARVPDYMVPAAFVELPSLPLTPNGKVDRRALPAPRRPSADGAGGAAGAAGAAPRSAVEKRLAGIWAELLRLDGAALDDDFFALGGHSLLAIQLVSRVREAFALELPLRVIFEASKVRELAAWIERARRAQDISGARGAPPPPVRRVPRDGPLPLSFAQERLWFLHLLAPASPIYNMATAVRLAGRLDAGALAAAVGELLRRHEALRTTFRATATGAVQEIQPWPLPGPPQAVIDLSRLPAAAGPREARRIVRLAAALPFDLRRGPLLRALLLRLAAADHVALWSTHHIASDGWSLTEVLVPEMVHLYAAAAGRRPSLLPEPPVQYADYAVWQRQWLAGETLAGQVGYWRRQLSGLAPLELPADRPRPPAPSGRGGSRPWGLPAGPTERLGRLARQGNATLFMALFAAFAAWLARATGQSEVPVGMPAANRSSTAIEGLIGFFVNTLVLRAELAGDPDFPALIARSRDTVLGAIAHQDVPFEKLVDELGLPRNPHRPPLLRVVFQLQTRLPAPAPPPAAGAPAGQEAPELAMAPFEVDVEAAKFDLVVHLFAAAGEVGGAFRYDADLFDEPTMARLAGQFTRLLEAWIDEPGRRCSELPLLCRAERHQLLVEWNPGGDAGAGAAERGRRCLHRRFETWVDRAPEAAALSVPGAAGEPLTAAGELFTYRELDRRANRLARHLHAAGVRPGDRVALALERSAEMVVAIFAALKAGAAYVPLDPASPAERLAFILEDSGASLLVTAGEPGASLALGPIPVVRLDVERGAIERRSGERLAAPDEAELPAYVIYTSGSTGRSKGVVVSHAGVERLFTATANWFGFGPGDVWTLFHSPAFDFSVWELLGALLHGGRLVVVPYWLSRSPADFLRLLGEERVTVLNQTPSAFRQLLWAEAAGGGGAVPELALRWVILGGEALEPASLAPWFARHGDERPRLVNMYGITETTVHVTRREVRTADLGGGSLIGETIPDLSVHLLDAWLQPVPIGVPGEIHVGGAGLAQGYLGRPDLTAERFVPDPFAGSRAGPAGARLYRSGDLARRTPRGDLEYLGRADRQVKIRGFRVEPGEIEAALAALPGVREAVVLVRDDGPGGERRLVAYWSGEVESAAAAAGAEGAGPARTVEGAGAAEGGEAAQAAAVAGLRRSLATRLPDYMLPAAFVRVEAFPLTENGKIDRRALPAPEAAGAAPAGGEPPRTPLERFLAGQFRDVLGLAASREIGTGDDFFELGGTSITSAILTHRLQEALGEVVHVVTIFDHPTVAALAGHLRERHAGAAARLAAHDAFAAEKVGVAAGAGLARGVLVPLQAGLPGRRPLFCVHTVGGEVVSYRELARRLGAEQPVYGLQSPDPPIEEVEQMAALYIAALRAVQPHGPYRLAGWSMGGIVAYEMARQLEAQGEKTEVLAVIDAASPARWAGERERSAAEMVTLFATALEQLHGGEVEIPPDLELPPVDPSGLDVDAALAIALDLGRRVGLLPPDLELAELRRIFTRFSANRRSLASYWPRPYGGKLHLFRAAARLAAMGEDDPTLGWGELLDGGLKVFEVPGDHRTILRAGVEALAERLRELLGER